MRYRVPPDVSPEVTLFARSDDGEEFISTQPAVGYTVERHLNLTTGEYECGLWFNGRVQSVASVRVISPRH